MAWEPYDKQPASNGGGGGGPASDGPDFELPANLLGWVFLGLVGVLLLASTRSAFYTVEPDEQAVVLRLGAFSEIREPGFHFKLPFGIDTVRKFATRRVHKEEFGFRTLKAAARTEYSQQSFDDESLVLTGDLNVADVEWIVQYRIQDPKAFWFHLDEPEQTVRDVSESVVRMVIGNRSVDEVLTVGRSRIEGEAFETMQKVLNDYDSGLKVVAVQLQNVTPPEPVQGSFNDVNRAEQDREKLENEALAKKNREIPKARGEAKRAIDRAKGYEVDRVNAARGETSRFLALLGEYKKAPEVTRARIYLESMRKVMGSVDDLTVLEQGSGVLPILDVNKLSGGGK